jgi:hypothetical protein
LISPRINDNINCRTAKALLRLDGPNHSNLNARLSMANGDCITKRSARDPIFEAIEGHRIAGIHYDSACALTDEAQAAQEGREVSEEDRAAFEGAEEAANDALDRLLSTRLTTMAGAQALIRYSLREFQKGELIDVAPRLLRNLLNSPLLDPSVAKAD